MLKHQIAVVALSADRAGLPTKQLYGEPLSRTMKSTFLVAVLGAVPTVSGNWMMLNGTTASPVKPWMG